MTVHTVDQRARVVEASVLIVPEPGVDVFDAIQQAELRGFREIHVHDDNTASVVFYRAED